MGIDQRVGSLEVGKDADIAIFEGHPLSVYAVPQYTIVDGVVRINRSKDAADQRLQASATRAETGFFLHKEQHNHDRCLEGAFENTASFFGLERE